MEACCVVVETRVGLRSTGDEEVQFQNGGSGPLDNLGARREFVTARVKNKVHSFVSRLDRLFFVHKIIFHTIFREKLELLEQILVYRAHLDDCHVILARLDGRRDAAASHSGNIQPEIYSIIVTETWTRLHHYID